MRVVHGDERKKPQIAAEKLAFMEFNGALRAALRRLYWMPSLRAQAMG